MLELPDDIAPTPAPADRDAAARGTPAGPPGDGKVLLWLGVGCLGIVVGLSVLVGGGALVLYSLAKDVDLARLLPSPAPAPARARAPADTRNFIDYPDEPDPAFPAPPVVLSRPPAPEPRVGGLDLLAASPEELSNWAMQLHGQANYAAAIRCQHYCVRKSDAGRYNLACFHARAGELDAAFYWLQEAARREGADAEWARRDDDLAALWRDPRWPDVLAYLEECQRLWEATGAADTTLVLPAASPPGRPLPVFIGLHGLGHNAGGFVNAELYQPFADRMGAAFVGVSGTHVRGKNSYVWAEDPAADLARIDSALAELGDRLTPATGQVVLFGFSQGGLVAAELALRHPDRFAGAIILSPGGLTAEAFPEVAATPAHQRQGVVAVCGALEHPHTVETTNRCAAAFTTAGARVFLRLYPDMNAHRFPPDFAARLPEWGRFILDSGASVPSP